MLRRSCLVAPLDALVPEGSTVHCPVSDKPTCMVHSRLHISVITVTPNCTLGVARLEGFFMVTAIITSTTRTAPVRAQNIESM